MCIRDSIGRECLVSGWVRTRRGSKNVAFIILNDGSSIKDLQIIVEEEELLDTVFKKINTGASISVRGQINQSKGMGQDFELVAKKITILGGGNTAFAVAARLSHIGNDICLLEHPDFAESLTDLSKTKEITLEGKEIKPMVTWGTSPQDVVTIDEKVPNPNNETDPDKKSSIERSLKYMGLKPGTAVKDIKIDKVFIGSCTNGRIGDLRDAAKVLKGKKIAKHVTAMVVPGSGLVKQQAEQEKIDKIFKEAGFEWREPGCSMCLAMNADKLNPKERCASTSNRNFEGRQGREGRTHLVSPAIAAASAIKGSFSSVEDL